jgi:hypothetical protein
MTGKGILLSAALEAQFSPAERRELRERMVARSCELRPADVEAGLAIWRQWLADAGMTVDEVAPVLARLAGCSAATVCKALASSEGVAVEH